MNILITGASGFLGGQYLRHLNRYQEHRLFACGRELKKLHALKLPDVQCFVGDLLDPHFVTKICKNIDVVVHCAAKSSWWGSYEAFYQANVLTTENVLRACDACSVNRLVYLGTPSIYQDYQQQRQINEDFLPRRFSSHYARTKYQAECRVLNSHSDQFATVSLRPRLVIGAGDNNFLPAILRLHQQRKLWRIGDLDTRLSVTSLPNFLQALDLCVLGSVTGLGTAYNIADPEPVLIWSLLDELFAELKMAPLKKHLPYWLAMAMAQTLEFCYQSLNVVREPPLIPPKVAALGRHFTLDIEKAQRQLEYQPKDCLAQALQDFIKDWQKTANLGNL